jgi:hypothetical protein
LCLGQYVYHTNHLFCSAYVVAAVSGRPYVSEGKIVRGQGYLQLVISFSSSCGYPLVKHGFKLVSISSEFQSPRLSAWPPWFRTREVAKIIHSNLWPRPNPQDSVIMDGERLSGPSTRARNVRTTAIKRDSLMAELERGKLSNFPQQNTTFSTQWPRLKPILNISIRPPTFNCKATTANASFHLTIGTCVSRTTTCGTHRDQE